MRDIVLFGAGKIAEVVRTYMEHDEQYRVVAHCVDREWLKGDRCNGVPLIAFDEVETYYPPESYGMFVAIGYHDLNAARAKRCAAARQKGYELVSYVSSRSWPGQGSFAHGDNCLVLDNATIQPGAFLGDNASIWSSVVVGHHSRVGDNAWIAAGASLGGDAEIGYSVFVGLNATVAHNVRVGDRCFLGSRVFVGADCETGGVYISEATARYRLDVDRFLRIANL